jgi:acetoin utilization deacetylase AcuC-like enzyme
MKTVISTPVFFHPDYNRTGLAFETTRKATAIARSLQARPIAGVELIRPISADRAEIETIHSADYVDAVITGEPIGLAGSNGIGWDEDLFASTCSSTGGARDAVLTALAQGGVAGSLSSGLHHARRERGSGFCTFNGLALAALAALHAGAAKVLILDLDAHCGGGTASLIAGVDGIEQIDVSVHAYDRYESRPDARLSIATADDYLTVIERELDGVRSPESIDVVIYNAGMDPHESAGGVRGIDADMVAARERLVFDWTASQRIPLAWVLAGGYLSTGLDIDGLTALHRLTITAAAEHTTGL